MDRPTNANEGCVGTQSDLAGKASGCAGCPNQSLCASGATKLPDPTMAQVKNHLKDVKHIILVLSGKGGVGKSTVSCQLAFGLAGLGHQVGLLDVDITGPSVPRMLGLTGQEVHQSNEGWSPVYVEDNLGVMSIGFMLPSQDDAIIWRGPKKSGLIKQFLTDVHWGELDYLIIDTPPGTSDEHISIVQYMKETRIDGAVVVTTPQEVAMADVRKELNFCRKTNLPVLGVIENMAGIQQNLDQIKFINTVTSTDDTTNVLQILKEKAPELLKYAVQLQVFPPASGGGEAMAKAFQVPFLGRLPLDANLTQACEQGVSFLEAYPNSSAVKAFEAIVKQVIALSASKSKHILYVDMMKESMANDLFWPNMSPTGAQMYLIELFSRHLCMTRKGTLDMFDPSNALMDNYNTQLDSHPLWPSYPRAIVYNELTTIRDAIQGFRLFDASYSFSLFTQYCWVDFDRRWEIAHTANRQVRCYKRYQTNGAMYLEAILRNVDWNSWSNANYPSFMQGVGNFITKSPEGEAWLASVPNAFQSIDTEVQYWTDKGIVNFVLQWNNRIQIGISESITVVNAFSSNQPLTTYHVVHSARGPTWTTFGLYWAFFDDLWAASTYNFSLVRNTTSSTQDNVMEDIYYVYPFTQASIVIHDVLGPFQSIDTFYIAPSSDIIAIITTFNAAFLLAIQTNSSLYSDYRELTTLTWDPVPKSWLQFDYQYYGGSPLCNAKAATAFVQGSFSFDDVCGQPSPLQMAINPQSALFAYFRLRVDGVSAMDSCRICLTSTIECTAVMHQLDTIYNGLVVNTTITSILRSALNVSSIDVEIIQFAQRNATSVILRQPLLLSEWSFYGYIGLYEWVHGHREVISFEGDAGVFVVLSEPIDSISFTAGALEILNTTSRYLWAMTVSTSVVLVVVATATLIFYFHDSSKASSEHLLFFNRIASPVWLGRPLMLLRSSTAIIVLSTSPIVFDSTLGLGRFHFEPRSMLYRFLLASEASWLTDVTIDVLLVFTNDIARVQAPVSSLVFWVVLVCLESAFPIRATAMIDRTCTRVNMDIDLTCTSGAVHIGSFSRVLTIVSLNFLSVFIGSGIAMVYQKYCSNTVEASSVNMLPASTLAFCPVQGDVWTIDASIACMSGIFRFHVHGDHFVLDTKLWVMFSEYELQMTRVKNLKPINIPTTMAIPVTQAHSRKQKLLLMVGLAYLVGTVAGSLSYIRLADVNFSNDFWWANFNSTGTLTFIANWFDKYRVLTPDFPSVELDNLAFADNVDYSKDNTVVTYSPLYAAIIQFNAANDIEIAIRGLRRTDGCLIPWIATQYCWLDFDKKYTMASTLRRQERCHTYQTNGAVYLEAPLRNVDWSEFESCWGASFGIAIAKELQGSSWLMSVKSNHNSIADEVVYWLNYNITSYSVQWQNYKTIGLIDTFSIENAFGIAYPINLQSTKGTFRFDQESSMKMYWTFARDLWAISMNNSGISGMSLLRESSRFAYQNTTPFAVYITNNTIASPLDPNFALFAAEIGPFGSVDLIHVPPPHSLLKLTQQILEDLSFVLATNGTLSQHAFQSLPVIASMMPVPLALRPHLVSGGSFLCDQMPVPTRAAFGMLLFFASEASCSLEISEMLFPESHQVFFAAIASGVLVDQIQIACSGDTVSPIDCIDLFQSILNFTTTFMPNKSYSILRQEAIRDLASIEMFQYIINTTTSTRQLYHQPLLDPSDPTMVLFSWMYLYDWAMGIREVVHINGDYSTLTLMSTFSIPTTFVVDAMEVPRNFSAYCRALSQYVSFILAMIAIIACLYSLMNQLTTEGYNLFETNRVGGLVWIGRPLLLVRSLTALAILSTATLELKVLGSVTVMSSTRSDLSAFMIFTTKLLAAGEVTWLVYIIQDLAMVFTRETTTSYGPIAGMLTWCLSICLSSIVPVAHKASINRQCSIDIMDYQVVCSTGTLVIGSVARFLTLIISSIGISIVCYIYHHYRYSNLRRVEEHPSSLLSCGAKYLFNRSEWVYDELYYIDFASAALTGLITIPRQQKLYIFDIKIWRFFVVDCNEVFHTKSIHRVHLKKALPLIQ